MLISLIFFMFFDQKIHAVKRRHKVRPWVAAEKQHIEKFLVANFVLLEKHLVMKRFVLNIVLLQKNHFRVVFQMKNAMKHAMG